MKIINNILLLFIFIITLSFPNFSFAKELHFPVGLDWIGTSYDGKTFFGSYSKLGESGDETLGNRLEHSSWSLGAREVVKSLGVKNRLILNFVAPAVPIWLWETTNENPNEYEIPVFCTRGKGIYKNSEYVLCTTLDTMYFEFHF